MKENIKVNLRQILEKFNIEKLNQMQEESDRIIGSKNEVILLSPTGTGKTLGFLIPIIKDLDPNLEEIQALIIAPSRELAIQIEQVVRQMGTGYKTNVVYGGRTGSLDKIDLKHSPSILIGTPGRIADHIRRENISTQFIDTLVLDEFDKSLEVGFESEMREITESLSNVQKKVLTSATKQVTIPDFLELKNPYYINYLKEGNSKLELKLVNSPSKDKLEKLFELLCHLGDQPGIVFCSFKDALQRVSDFLTEKNISHGCFHGGMEQIDRERSLIKFRNGTHQLLVATDLAARGIDIPEIKFIIHYHLPIKSKEFVHRNGRTARMNSEGTAYILKWEEEELPEYIDNYSEEIVNPAPIPKESIWSTLYISGGRKDKISKGDIAGLFFKQGNLEKEHLGNIEIKQDCAFVGIHREKENEIIKKLNNSRLKKKKVRISKI